MSVPTLTVKIDADIRGENLLKIFYSVLILESLIQVRIEFWLKTILSSKLIIIVLDNYE